MDLRAGGVSKPLARRESIGKTVRSPPCGGAPEYNHYEIRFFGYTHCPCFKSGKGLFLRGRVVGQTAVRSRAIRFISHPVLSRGSVKIKGKTMVGWGLWARPGERNRWSRQAWTGQFALLVWSY